MSRETESILGAAIGRFRSMSPTERRAAIQAAASRARQAGCRAPGAADVRVWDLGAHRVFDVRASASESKCIACRLQRLPP